MTSVGARIAFKSAGVSRLLIAVSLRNPLARADTGRMVSSIAFTRACSRALASGTNSGGVASTVPIIGLRATRSADQNRKSEPMTDIIVFSTQDGIAGADAAWFGGM